MTSERFSEWIITAFLRDRDIDFINGYLLLGNIMPQPEVLKEFFLTSSPTSTGVSLNDLQSVGTTLQEDLSPTVLKFLKYLCDF